MILIFPIAGFKGIWWLWSTGGINGFLLGQRALVSVQQIFLVQQLKNPMTFSTCVPQRMELMVAEEKNTAWAWAFRGYPQKGITRCCIWVDSMQFPNALVMNSLISHSKIGKSLQTLVDVAALRKNYNSQMEAHQIMPSNGAKQPCKLF